MSDFFMLPHTFTSHHILPVENFWRVLSCDIKKNAQIDLCGFQFINKMKQKLRIQGPHFNPLMPWLLAYITAT